MRRDEIYEAWEQDSVFERDLLTEESIKIPQLHSKWMKMLSNERMRHKSLLVQYKGLFKDKHEYYRGDLDFDILKERGWDPFDLKVLRSDLDLYMQSDKDLSDLHLKVELQQEKVKFIESVIQQINNRGFQIKNVIDWEKFKSGL